MPETIANLPFFSQLYDLEETGPVSRIRDPYPDTGESGDTYDIEEAVMRTGNSVEPFICTICGEKFQSYLSLIEHFENGQCNTLFCE